MKPPGSRWNSPQLWGGCGDEQEGREDQHIYFDVFSTKGRTTQSFGSSGEKWVGEWFIEGCDKLNYSFLILTFPLLYNSHLLSCRRWEKHKQMCKDRKLQSVMVGRE